MVLARSLALVSACLPCYVVFSTRVSYRGPLFCLFCSPGGLLASFLPKNELFRWCTFFFNFFRFFFFPIFGGRRWCVTGTPIGKGSIDDLYGLLVFLKVGIGIDVTQPSCQRFCGGCFVHVEFFVRPQKNVCFAVTLTLFYSCVQVDRS